MKTETPHAVTQQVQFLLSQMVAGHAEVTQEVDASGKVSLLVQTSKANYGIINGKKSRMLKALKYIAERCGAKTGCVVELTLDPKSRHNIPPPLEFVQNPEADCEGLIRLLKAIVGLLINEEASDSITWTRDVDLLEAVVKIDRSDPWAAASMVAVSEVFFAIGMRRGVELRVRKWKAEKECDVLLPRADRFYREKPVK